MKKVAVVLMVLIITLGILIIGNGEAKAMNTGEAILLGGVIAIFARPVLQAVVGEIFYPPVYQPTQIIYAPAPNYNPQPNPIPRTAYERGMVDEQLRIERELDRYEYQRGRQDARRYYFEE